MIPADDAHDPPRDGGIRIRVRGLVQGVGFRPTVWHLARDCGLDGEVWNDAEGVVINAWGNPDALLCFQQRLKAEVPPLARIDALESQPLNHPSPSNGFRIVPSKAGDVHTGIVADAATCAHCVAEINDPENRRYNYPFTNCTHCGPRLSIVQRIPYDRANTSMSVFELCPECHREYEDPADRRFHAQPVACPKCGPQLRLEPLNGVQIDPHGDPIRTTQRLLQSGLIVAIKGIGGIHLAVDASNSEAVRRLRERKRRSDKPFALMARDSGMISDYCQLSVTESALLHSPAAPIVLLNPGKCKPDTQPIASEVAPNQSCLGFMLPYSPLHHLLMNGMDAPIVLTSGNRSEEPQCIRNPDARQQLGDIADVLLLHDRDIVNRLDDSVARVIAGEPCLLRRARGYAPAPLILPAGFEHAPPVLAFGGELKNTVCLLKDGQAILSQHLGDLQNASAHAAYQDALKLYLDTFKHEPQVLAIDSHPEYLPSKRGREWFAACPSDTELYCVQHHHAHIASCMAENGLEMNTEPVLGIALDGTGYGFDSTFWGGEFLLTDYRSHRRLATFEPLPMPGGEQAIRQPWRMAYVHLLHAGLLDEMMRELDQLPFVQGLSGKPLLTLNSMIASRFNSPLTSSCGRLFDAVAAAIGIRQTVSYEGQAAIELEAAIDPRALDEPGYPFAIKRQAGLAMIDSRPMWQALLKDLREQTPIGEMAAHFHVGLARAISHMINHLKEQYGDLWQGRVALSGGVFQNAVLSQQVLNMLEENGWRVLRQQRVPANDGGLSLGQAVIAAAKAMDH